MSATPEIVVVAGSPAPAEAEAARKAIIELWRSDTAAAARSGAGDAWTRAARRDATRGSGRPAPWSRSLGFARLGETTARRVGRGDTR